MTQLHFIATTKKGETRPIAYFQNKLHVLNGKSENTKKVKAGEDWFCDIVEELKNNVIVVNPVKLVITKDENDKLLCDKKHELKKELESKWGKTA